MLTRAWNKLKNKLCKKQLLEFNKHFHGIINSTTFLLELKSGAFANQLLWTSCKHGPTGKAQA